MAVVVLTAENFDREVLQSPVPVFVDFHADWCGPCKQMIPVIEELANEYGIGQAKIAKLNVDQVGGIAQRYGVMSIPVFKIFKGGQVVDECVGIQPKDMVKQRLDTVISQNV